LVFEFRLPDIGEGVAEGEILKWMVKEGDEVKEDQPLVEVMTDKVNVQIPAPRSGKVSKIMVKEGDIAKVGQTITVIDDGSSGAVAPVIPQDSPSRITKRPIVRDSRVEVRDITYLSLSFDHRVFDGAYTARFTSRVIETLQDTKKLLAEVLWAADQLSKV